jgi:hypothetical protein
MKNFLGCLIGVIGFAFIGLDVRADTKVELITKCTQAVRTGDQAKATELASKIAILIGITNGQLQYEGTQCLNAVFGKCWYYYGPSSSYLNTDPKILSKSLAGLSEDEVISRLAKLGAMRESVEQMISANRSVVLKKQLACASLKEAEILSIIKEIDQTLEERNRMTNDLLILQGTHKACSLLHDEDQSAAMLNHSCIDAFQRMGHPNFILEERKKDDAYSSQVNELRNLMSSIKKELVLNRSESAEASVEELSKQLQQQSEEYTEAKSCAEFGYEGVYLD